MMEHWRLDQSSQRMTNVRTFCFSVIWVDKESTMDKKEFLSNLEPFDVDDVLEIQGLNATSLDPQLLETTDEDPNLKMVQDHIVSWIQYYIQQYEDVVKRTKDAHISNAMTFYKNFLRGVFGHHAGAVIIVNGNTFKVWEFEESAVGERAVLSKLASEPSGTFASPAKGYWMSNLITEQELSDPRYDTMRREIGLMMSRSFPL